MTARLELRRPAPKPIEDWQYRRLVESVHDYAIYLLDTEGVVITWNAGAERFKGYRAEEIIGRNFSLFYTPDDQAKGEPRNALTTAARDGRYKAEGWRVRKGGRKFWATVSIEPIWDGGEIIGFAKVTRDITERRETETSLDRAIAALNQAQKMESFGQLAGGLTHDFNNVLASLQGSLELLGKCMPTEPRAEGLLDGALQAIRRGSALTHRMLAFARRQELAPEPVHLPSLVRGMIGLLEPALGPQISLRTQFPSRHHPVFADANQLEMAVLNLAVNARDAMPDGGEITIAVREETLSQDQVQGLKQGAYTCLSVRDNGVGMDVGTLSRAVEPFYTTKGPGKGTGLGLSMVQGLAARAGGRLVLTSTLGEGALVELWMPLFSPADPGAVLPATERAWSPGRRNVVLAVDDNPVILLNTIALLQDLGFEVFGADSAREALELLAKAPTIDLVVSDVEMKPMDGRQLLKAARERYPWLAFLLVSGYEPAVLGEDAGSGWLTKPFSQEELAAAIKDVMAAQFSPPQPGPGHG